MERVLSEQRRVTSRRKKQSRDAGSILFFGADQTKGAVGGLGEGGQWSDKKKLCLTDHCLVETAEWNRDQGVI